MPNKALSVNTVLEKNKLASGNAFLVLMEIQVMNAHTGQFVETIFVANNNEPVVFQNETYVPFPFDLELKEEAGALPELTLRAMDFQKVLMNKLNEFGGAAGSILIMRIVNSANLNGSPEIEETFELLESSANDFQITLKIGVESSLRKIFPRRTQMRDRCAWRYKSAECGYNGSLPTCDLTLQGPNGCAAHGNTVNFGGFPGLVSRGIRYGR